MTGQDGLRDGLIETLANYQTRGVSSSGGAINIIADDIIDNAVLPVVQARIDAAREQVAEQIAQAIEDAADAHERLIADIAGVSTPRRTGTSSGLRRAARIARQHAKGDSDE